MATSMQQKDFYKLPRSVQERLLAAAARRAPPEALLVTHVTDREPWIWLGISGAGVVGLVVLVRLGMGDLSSSLATHGLVALGMYVVFMAAIVSGLVRFVALQRDARRLHLKRGHYLFPLSLVDVRGPSLRVFGLDELTHVEKSPAGQLVLTFGRERFAFLAPSGDALPTIQSAIQSGQQTLRQPPEDHRKLAAIDPLMDTGFASPLIPASPLRRQVPPWERFFWGVGLAVGVMLGPLLWLGRNASSDARMFARAVQKDEAEAYRSYLLLGKKHRDEVETVLLPRVELRRAIGEGTVAAIAEFKKDHPQARIEGEVSTALRAALLAELATAKKARTLEAIDAFVRAHPDHGLTAEVKQAKSLVFSAAFERYKTEAPNEPSLLAFVRALLGVAENRGPRVEVRFFRRPPRSLDRADKAVSKHPQFMGTATLPSRFYDEAHARPREAALARAIEARFAETFPSEVLAVKLGAPIESEGELQGLSVPTLVVEHSTEWSAGVYPLKAPRAVLVGIGMLFESSFRLPDATKPRTLKSTIWRNPKLDGLPPDERPEERVYGQMGEAAFEEFGRRLLATFFKKR